MRLKLRNKHTGEIDYFEIESPGFEWLAYSSLSEFCEDWEDWEGIVATPLVEMRNQKGERVIVKIKNRDYLRGEE